MNKSIKVKFIGHFDGFLRRQRKNFLAEIKESYYANFTIISLEGRESEIKVLFSKSVALQIIDFDLMYEGKLVGLEVEMSKDKYGRQEIHIISVATAQPPEIDGNTEEEE